MKQLRNAPDAGQLLAARQTEAVEAIDLALKYVSLLVEAREQNHFSTSRVRAVAKEMAELRKVLAVYVQDAADANSVSTACRQETDMS